MASSTPNANRASNDNDESLKDTWDKVTKAKLQNFAASEEYRRRLLVALEFYAASPSLILNSDLPADLVELVTRGEFPLVSLALILQLKKGTGSVTTGGDEKKVPEALTRKLAEWWMSSEACAEALVSLSLGDEVPGNIAESVEASRLTLAIAEYFTVPRPQFQRFVFRQLITALKVLAFGVREDYEGSIRSSPLSLILDRTTLRFYADEEQFFASSPFAAFLQTLASECEKDFVARRLSAKVFLGLGNHAVAKLSKTAFLLGVGEKCVAWTLFYPGEEFMSKLPHALTSSIPQKTPTVSQQFWSNWAHFVYVHSGDKRFKLWETTVSNWESLCRSPAITSQALLPPTYALVALAREFKIDGGLKSPAVFDSLASCLDSTSEEKKACGMALAQIMADLHTFSDNIKAPKLQFSSSSPIFAGLIKFYENGPETAPQKLPQHSQKKEKIEILDSDDEFEDDDDDDDDEENYGEEKEADIPRDERILDYRSKAKGKLPEYFSEIMELLTEGGPRNTNEGEVEALKYLCVMKIPVLLSARIRIDENMASTLVKALLAFEGDSNLEIPIVLALYELSICYPVAVFEQLATSSFDSDHFTSGARMMLLRRVGDLVGLLSKSTCFSCFLPRISPSCRKELISICPEFFLRYFDRQRASRYCSSCKGPEQTPIVPQEQAQEQLSWREIVDARIAAKSRYFYKKTKIPMKITEDEYATRYIPIIWASIANRLMKRSKYFNDEVSGPPVLLLAQSIRLLGRIILGLGSPSSPHLSVIANQVGEVVTAFCFHSELSVRHASVSLLAIIVTISDGASYILESLGINSLALIQRLRDRESDESLRTLLDHTSAYLATAATLDFKLELNSTGDGDGIYSKIKFLH